MKTTDPYRLARMSVFLTSVAVIIVVSGVAGGPPARADGADLQPGNLLLSRVVYDNNPNNVTVGMTLPPGCTSGCVTAVADGTYPFVFNNAPLDGSFGITSKIVLDQLTRSGQVVSSIEVPNSSQQGVPPTKDQMVGSFSSKSEVALNLSTDRQFVTFMGYLAPIDTLDVSNSNTPAVIDPTNPVSSAVYRAVAQLDRHGKFHFTETNAYSGNNGRAAILNNQNGANLIYTAGNAGNGANPQPAGVILGAGLQIMTAETKALVAQVPPNPPTPVGSFNVTELGDKADKIGKDTNFRGLTIFNNVVYATKGSGGNGVNTVYFIDTSGSDPTTGNPLQCLNGTGLPKPFASLPSSGIVYDGTQLATKGAFPYNMCVLQGFPTTLAKTDTSFFPFGVWFANAKTLYVADEGNGDATYNSATNTFTVAAAQTNAGLQKWVFDDTLGAWKLAYVLQTGLGLGTPYNIPGYPTGLNTALKTPIPFPPATDGLRNLTGRVNDDGTVTIWAITSTVSGSGDQGADPNKLVTITDQLAATSPPTGETFTTIKTAGFAEVLRGISFTPGTGDDD
jgi:hypothetical protein